jgi:multicomponent K+:H+ antiporter subunit G
MQIIFEIIISFFLIFGAFFMLVGSIGMIRLPDLFMRLHAPTKSSTLGLGSFLIAAMIFGATQGRFGFAELLITLFAFITAPVSANLMAQAAIHLRLRSTSGDVPEALNRPLPWQRYRRNAEKKDQLYSMKNKLVKDIILIENILIIKKPPEGGFLLELILYRLALVQADPSQLPRSDQTYSYHRHWFYRNGNAILA